MLTSLYSISPLSVVIAFVANVAVGFYWYSPAGFGHAWMKGSGLTQEKLEKNNPAIAMASAMVLNFLTTLSMAVVFALIDVQGMGQGIGVAVLLWAGFVAATQAKFALFEGRPMQLIALYCGQSFVSFVLMGLVLGVWR